MLCDKHCAYAPVLETPVGNELETTELRAKLQWHPYHTDAKDVSWDRRPRIHWLRSDLLHFSLGQGIGLQMEECEHYRQLQVQGVVPQASWCTGEGRSWRWSQDHPEARLLPFTLRQVGARTYLGTRG